MKSDSLFDPSLLEKEKLHHKEKQRIAAAAIKLVSEGQCVILDSGTTTTAIATADINNPQSAPSALYTDDDPVVPSTTGPLNPVPPLPLGVPVQPHRVQQLYNHQNSFTQVESDLGNS